jgi:hypothetical protein
VPRGGLGDLAYGARRTLVLHPDRELADALAAAAERAELPPEALAVAVLRRALVD